MRYTAILFDLDGTLLPMDLDVFLDRYFSLLLKRVSEHTGSAEEGKRIGDAVWTATYGMIQNNGAETNETVFWKRFRNEIGKRPGEMEPLFDEFYRNDFQLAKEVCGFNPKAVSLIKKLREENVDLILATAPVYPRVATESRLKWAGLSPEDFSYITTYENSSYGKPNPEYYREILRKRGLNASSCLMIGNDTSEDGIAEQVGIPVFYLTDCLINKNNLPLDSYPHGDFDDLETFLLS